MNVDILALAAAVAGLSPLDARLAACQSGPRIGRKYRELWHNTHCSSCHVEIPKGRSGRRCATCREVKPA